MKRSLELKQETLLSNLIDYIFWFFLILFTNPGGILDALNIWYIIGRFNIRDLLFILLSICYIIIPKIQDIYDLDFKLIKKFLILFLVYYFIVFAYWIPVINGSVNYSFNIALIKSRWTLYSIFLFIYIYEFFKRRFDVFVKILVFSSISILFLFLIQIIIKIHILPVNIMNRGFINMDRMYGVNISRGLFPLLIPMGVVVIVFKPNVKFKKIIIISFVMLSLYYLVSITRRDILSIFFFFLLAVILKTIITRKYKTLFLGILKSLVPIIFLIFASYFVFPKYLEATKLGIIDSFNIIKTGEEINGQKDERLGLRPFIVQQFLTHPSFGTGFDNRWRTKEGDNQGFEASDYPFLAALAMFGVAGILVFLPVYLLIIKILKKDISYLRNKIEFNRQLIFVLLFTFILFFTFNLFQYFNYFMAVANSDFYYWWYFYLSLYLAARSKFYCLDKNVNLNLILKSKSSIILGYNY